MTKEVLVSTEKADGAPSVNILTFDLQGFFLGGIFMLMALAACFVAADIILPIVLAFILKLVFQPVMRILDRCRLPRMISALLVILFLMGAFAGVGAAISVPAANWSHQLATDLPKVQARLHVLSAPIEAVQKFMHRAESWTNLPGSEKTTVVAVQNTNLSERILNSTRDFASGFFEMLIVLFFLLISGDTFLRRTVEILPRFQDKKQAVNISQHIERNISIYLLTITFMNLLVGCATALIMYFCHVGDPLLWGTVAFLLNYIPILGPIFATGLFAFIGLVSVDGTLAALLPAGLYFIVHLVEGEALTPMILARRFTLNPVLVIIALIFWYWMWGVPGAILATPMLAIAKIICDQIENLKPFGHFMEG